MSVPRTAPSKVAVGYMAASALVLLAAIWAHWSTPTIEYPTLIAQPPELDRCRMTYPTIEFTADSVAGWAVCPRRLLKR